MGRIKDLKVELVMHMSHDAPLFSGRAEVSIGSATTSIPLSLADLALTAEQTARLNTQMKNVMAAAKAAVREMVKLDV